MLRLLAKSVCMILLGSIALCAEQQPGSEPVQGTLPHGTLPKTVKRAKPAASKQVTQQPQIPQQPPPPPPTLEQMPAQVPQVTFSNGMLSISSQNSTLADILSAVRRQTGAGLELPPGAASERVAARLGPGQPKDVIASLLNGSRFDYIILGSLQRPSGLERIILTPRSSGPAGQPANAQGGPVTPPVSADESEPIDAEMEEDNAPERDGSVEGTNEVEPAQTQQNQPYQPVPVPQGQPDPNQPQPQGGQPNQPQVKTPEELLRELQQMRQQQQQQQQPQQQQNEEAPPPQDTPNQPPQ